MTSRKPSSIKDFFDFYYEDFKPLYCHLQSLNDPPVEMFFEVNAALDHLSRYWHYGEEEQKTVHAACAHLKRACFDAFKIVMKETLDHYKELKKIDTSIIDGGRFDREMIALINEIKQGSREARMSEGDSRTVDLWHNAYELWKPVYVNCCRFEQEFYLHGQIEWAKKKEAKRNWKDYATSIIIGVVSGLLVIFIGFLFPYIAASFAKNGDTIKNRPLPETPGKSVDPKSDISSVPNPVEIKSAEITPPPQ